MDNVPFETGYDYEPEVTGGIFLRMRKKGDKVKIRLASKPVQFRKMYQEKEKQAFAWIVIDREDGTPKVFEAGVSIYLQIRNFALNEDWGDPEKYDFTIERTEASTANYYAVTPSPKHSDITAEEKQAIVDSGIDLIAICAKAGDKLKSTKTFPNEDINPDEIPDFDKK
jgi:hypothetical protein